MPLHRLRLALLTPYLLPRTPCLRLKNLYRLGKICMSSLPSSGQRVISDTSAIRASIKVNSGHCVRALDLLKYRSVVLLDSPHDTPILRLLSQHTGRGLCCIRLRSAPVNRIQVEYVWKGKKSWGKLSGFRTLHPMYSMTRIQSL